MNKNEVEMTDSEVQLLQKLQNLATLTSTLVSEQQNRRAGMVNRDSELTNLRRQVIELKEENQHLKELIHTWKERMSSLLKDLK